MRIACTLGSEDHRDRRERWLRLIEETRITPRGVHLRLRRASGVAEEARDLVELERECCSFARWTVDSDCPVVVVDASATGEGIKALHAMFEGG